MIAGVDSINLISCILVPVLCSIIASSGLWMLVLKKVTVRDGRDKMVMGLGHDRIVYLGKEYIRRGYITADEYENLHEYLYKPYCAINGNGSAEHIMNIVQRLPVKDGRLTNGYSMKPNDEAITETGGRR